MSATESLTPPTFAEVAEDMRIAAREHFAKDPSQLEYDLSLECADGHDCLIWNWKALAIFADAPQDTWERESDCFAGGSILERVRFCLVGSLSCVFQDEWYLLTEAADELRVLRSDARHTENFARQDLRSARIDYYRAIVAADTLPLTAKDARHCDAMAAAADAAAMKHAEACENVDRLEF